MYNTNTAAMFTNDKLNATKNGQLVGNDLLEMKIDEWDDLRGYEYTFIDYWKILSLYGFFYRLSEDKRNQPEVKDAFDELDSLVTNMADEQVAAVIGLFDSAFWQKTLDEVTDDWLNNRISDDEMFFQIESLLSMLNSYSLILAVARDRGFVSCMESSEWDELERCADHVQDNEIALRFMSNWVQSMASLIDENIYERNESMYLAAGFWKDWLDWLYANQQVEENDLEYVQFVKDRFVSMLTKTIEDNN